MNALFLIGRVFFGGFFIISAYSHFKNAESMSGYARMKGVPYPKAAVLVSGLLAFVGGASVILGVRPDLGLGAIIVFLVPVTFMMHPFWKDHDADQKNMDRINFMKNAALVGSAIMLLAVSGPWAW